MPVLTTSIEEPTARELPVQRSRRRRLWIVRDWGFAEWFVVGQTVLPAILFLPGTQSLRVPIRILPFAISLLALVVVRRRKPGHPAEPWLLGCVLWLLLMVFHPTTNTIIAGIAQAALYAAVLAPVFWAPHLVNTPTDLKRILRILLVCNGINACVGVMQVYDPDTWLPREFSQVVLNTEHGLDKVSYVGADGRRIIRPTGLFDAPGSVCGPATLAGLLGLVFCCAERSLFRNVIALAMAFAGVSAIFLSQVRTSFLILLGTGFVYTVILALQRRHLRALAFAKLSLVCFVAGAVLAIALGGRSVEERFLSLLDGSPAAVYERSQRGPMLRHAFTNIMADYPFGAGLGRWGMMRVYFGNESNRQSPAIWCEMQVPGWLLDGGVVLLLLYCGALVVASSNQVRVALRPSSPELQRWSAPVVALCAGTIALLLSYAPFVSQVGMQYWFLVGALYGVSVPAQPREARCT